MDSKKKKDKKNLKMLQHIIQSDPANNNCCDCNQAGARWASYTIGCFLCIRCAGLHRKLATISRIKSVTLDSWTEEQIEFMRSNGNRSVNKKYIPTSNRCPIPPANNDAEMEKYIRDKYERQIYMSALTKQSEAEQKYTSQISQLRQMGFTNIDRMVTALVQSNGDVNQAIDYLTSLPSASQVSSSASQGSSSSAARSEPQELNAPPPYQRSQGTPKKYEAELANLQSMGFTNEKDNLEALEVAQGNIQTAVNLLVECRPGSTLPPPPQSSSNRRTSQQQVNKTNTAAPAKPPAPSAADDLLGGLDFDAVPAPSFQQPVQAPAPAQTRKSLQIQPLVQQALPQQPQPTQQQQQASSQQFALLEGLDFTGNGTFGSCNAFQQPQPTYGAQTNLFTQPQSSAFGTNPFQQQQMPFHTQQSQFQAQPPQFQPQQSNSQVQQQINTTQDALPQQPQLQDPSHLKNNILSLFNSPNQAPAPQAANPFFNAAQNNTFQNNAFNAAPFAQTSVQQPQLNNTFGYANGFGASANATPFFPAAQANIPKSMSVNSVSSFQAAPFQSGPPVQPVLNSRGPDMSSFSPNLVSTQPRSTNQAQLPDFPDVMDVLSNSFNKGQSKAPAFGTNYTTGSQQSGGIKPSQSLSNFRNMQTGGQQNGNSQNMPTQQLNAGLSNNNPFF
jgi:hypothetical protein